MVTKGTPSLIEFCKIRRDTLLQDHLEIQNKQEPMGRVLVHPKCCRAYIHPKRAKRSSDSAPHPSPKISKLRSNQRTFQWKTHYLFCNKKVIIDDIKHKNRYPKSHWVRGKEKSVQLTHKSEKDATKGMTILPQMCESSCLSARTLLLMKQYIMLSAMPKFSSIHAAPMVIKIVLSALKCKLFSILHVTGWRLKSISSVMRTSR